MELIKTDDCISKIYKNYNNTNFIFFQNDNICDPNINDIYPYTLISYIPYEYGEKIYFDLIDIGGYIENIGELNIIVYVNEFIIRTNHTKFWKCTNCEGENGNYIYNNISNSFYFYDSNLNIYRGKKTYYFYFQINSFSELNYG